MENLATLIMAAGQGTRMKSSLPKVIHHIGGRPLVCYPIELAKQFGSTKTVVVVGHGRSQVEDAIAHYSSTDTIHFAIQKEQKGTGHAVMSALPSLKGHSGPVLILSGDVPLLSKTTIKRLQTAYKKSGGPLALVSFEADSPDGYGRVIRKNNTAVAIREDKDCSKSERLITESNAGIYLIDINFLKSGTTQLKTNNAQGELYLTDLIALAARKHTVPCVLAPEQEVSGVNDRIALIEMEAILQKQIVNRFLKNGVTIRQPSTVHIDVDVKIGQDTEIGPGVQLHGSTRIGKQCVIQAGAVITDSTVKDGAIIRPYSILENASVGPQAQVGPMARLRPGSVLKQGAKVGNWVELKNTSLGKGSKANHLAYLGDGNIGENVNVGAGVIFCNYDGVAKHQTTLKNGVFVGSDCQIVAPVTVGEDSYVASGSTITKDVPDNTLTISRSPQENKIGYAHKLRELMADKKDKRKK